MDKTEVLPQGALVIWGDFDQTQSPVSESELNQWWTFEHLPERLAVPGFQRCRRYIHSDPQTAHSKYLVWYEVSNLSSLTSVEYMKALNSPTDGTKQCMPVLATLSRSACRILQCRYRQGLRGTGNGCMIAGAVLHIVIIAPEEVAARESLCRSLEDMLTTYLLENPTCVSFHVLEHDEKASRVGSASKSYTNTKFQHAGNENPPESKWMLLLELASTICSMTQESMSKALKKKGVHVLEVESYQVVCVLSRE